MSAAHPNWVGLATCRIKLKRFVKAAEPDKGDEAADNGCEQQVTVPCGEEPAGLYDSLNGAAEDDDDCQVVAEKRRTNVAAAAAGPCGNIKRSRRKRVKGLNDRASKNQFLMALEANEVNTARRLMDQGVPCDLVDNFGWNALMVAACAGSRKCVKLLLARGCDVEYKSPSGDSAETLADKKGHSGIARMIRLDARRRRASGRRLETVDLCEEVPPVRCQDCREEYCQGDRPSHLSSMVHQIALAKDRRQHPAFIIPPTNAGYKIMKNSGWDEQSGLGPGGKGKLYPVKTVLKQDRSGLQDGLFKSAKVTHFAPGDASSLKTRAKASSLPRRAEKTPSDFSEQTLRTTLGHV